MITNFKTFLLEAPEYNRGDIAEAIFASALAARFLVKPEQKVSKSDVEKALERIMIQHKNTETRKDKDNITVDTIKLDISVPKKATTYLSSKKNWPQFSDIFDSCIYYVNTTRRLNLQAKVYYMNNKKNTIEVKGEGTKNQKGSKVDIALLFDGKRSKNQISLKTKGGEQFGQVSGVSFDKQHTLWREGFDIDIASLKSEFIRNLGDFNEKIEYETRADPQLEKQKSMLRNAIKPLFTKIASKINQLSTSGEIDLVEHLIKFIRKHATKDEHQYVEFVKIDKKKTQSLRFEKKFEKNIREFNFTAHAKVDGDPTIIIRETTNNKPLIQMRYKIEAASGKKAGKKIYRVYPRTLFELPTNSILFDLG